MATDVAMFRARFPEFADPTEFPDPRIQLFLDDAKDIYMGDDEDRWCNKYNYAQAYLAAHLLTKGSQSELGQTSATSGPIQSKTAGGVSVSRATVAKDRSESEDSLMSTTYGQQFLVTRNTCFIGILSTGG